MAVVKRLRAFAEQTELLGLESAVDVVVAEAGQAVATQKDSYVTTHCGLKADDQIVSGAPLLVHLNDIAGLAGQIRKVLAGYDRNGIGGIVGQAGCLVRSRSLQ